MNPRYDLQLMVKVAQLYYESGLKQEEIARELEISRSSISMILAEAREFGIIQITIKNPVQNHDEYSAYIRQKFQLDDALVIPTTLKSAKLRLKLTAERAAEYVRERAGDFDEQMGQSGCTFGIAWGSTCYEFMSSFPSDVKVKSPQIVPLLGGTSQVQSEYQLNEMVRLFAEKVNGIPTFIYAPGIPDSMDDHDLYMKSTDMQNVIDLWKKIGIAVISVGAPPEYYGNEEDYILPDVSLFSRERMRPVGDICARRFNYLGEFFQDDYNRKLIAIQEEQLKSAEKVICVVSGEHKVFSIIGALRSGLIDVLISDEITMKRVIQYLDNE